MPPFPSFAAPGPVAASIYKSAFDPVVDLSTLLYLLHPDDLTDIVGGEANSLTDRKASKVWAAPASGNRMQIDTTDRPGHTVLSAAATSDYLMLADASIADAIAGGPCTWFVFRRLTGSTGTSRNYQLITNSATFGAGSEFYAQQSSSTNVSLQVRSAATSTTYTAAYTPTTDWVFQLSTYDGVDTVSHYINNALLGTDTDTERDPTGLTHCWIGGSLNTLYSVMGVMTSEASSAERTALYNWVIANA